uniref:vomeronasal type-1 receptor 4-like n=1 Tax=Jaculus jaculus TaxID=51337 RepID=UPI001E1B3569|nr:vomeronasal type-1 receptor 4-like [Jaculus jaculus]
MSPFPLLHPKAPTAGVNRMEASNVVAGIILLSQTVAGILGNSFLLYHYLTLYFTGYSLKSTDVILQHLNVANFLTLLCRGVPQTLAAFGLQDFLGDLGCKLIFYFHRVGRGMSLCSTCLLSIFQAIGIRARGHMWAELKTKTQNYTDSFIYLSWILHLFGNIPILKSLSGNQVTKNMTGLKDYGYCFSARLDKIAEILIAAFMSFSDVVCMGIMLWASSSIVLLLYRHKQRMQHVLRTTVCPRPSPESRATKTVLLLVSTFVFFYTLSCVFQLWFTLVYSPSLYLQNTAVVFAGCFPTVSPFLLLSHDSRSYRLCFRWLKDGKSP